MNHIEFTTALIRLSRHKVGVAEACTLFALAEDTSSDKIAKALGVGKDMARGRIGILKAKKLAEAVWKPDGKVLYRLTPRGRSIIAETLKTGKP